MAGQIALDTKYYPSDFNLLSVPLPLTLSTGGGIQKFPLLYADRDLVVDSVRLYLPGAPGANVTFTLFAVTNSALATGAVSATELQVSDTSGSFTTGATYPAVHTFTLRTLGTTANNLIRAGSTLWLFGSATWTSGGAIGLPPLVQIRYRSSM